MSSRHPVFLTLPTSYERITMLTEFFQFDALGFKISH
jgi:hypothetical protein